MNALMSIKSIKIGKVGYVGQSYDRHIYFAGDCMTRLSFKRHRVLGLDVHVFKIRHHTEHRHSADAFDNSASFVKKTHIAAKFIDYNTFDALAVIGTLKHHGAVDARKHPATVYVGHKYHGSAGISGHRHVDKVAVAKIKLRDTSGSFHNNRIITLSQTVISGMYLGAQLFATLAAEVLICVTVADRTSVKDYLRRSLARWLKQQRIHIGTALHSGRLGLNRLSTAYLQTVGRGIGVQSHILGLERGGRITVLPEYTAQSGGNNTLADITARTGQHDW